ncbi:MAG: hypothetical protein A3E83_08915 [Gammaproteobacteria bacterium RIFCSPHIGHO2_12_FULL_41_20]|nr:MAG: hypothetical protein A3E83_08915 [Gammaproteobacteria bacterium RIFCSPHIGHO2_12_FULL_41_20]
MAIKDAFKVSWKTFFNPTAWFGYESFKSNNRMIGWLLRGLLFLSQPEQHETFEEAIQRLNLTDVDLRDTEQTYRVYAWFFVILGVAALVFGLYLLFHHGMFLSLLLSLSAMALFLSQAFKYHFWAFQIKHRKLGCTYREWRRGSPNKGPMA